ncbi:serine hydrolase [Rubrivirga sp. SAORIC476]|uniref:serine hydrolase n=1 Tax=Rubrivirga sp. SAORIC476 TaxID=1961794 RepID=UPI000BA919BF|nr:serine hydrolase [Rubrivirga sp. SAORIC476]
MLTVRLGLLATVVALSGCIWCPGPLLVTASPDPLAETVDAIVAQYPGATVAVAVRSPSRRFDRLADRTFHAASTMKVGVMIEAFRQVQAGRRAWDDPVRVENRFRSIVDGTEYQITDDSDDGLYALQGRDVTFRTLTERAITTSSNLATNLLIGLVTAESVQATMDRLGAPGLRVLRGVEDLKAFEAGLSNATTADALATVLEAIRDGRAVSPAADAEMVDILDDQAFNEMIPAGLPAGTRVAHKTGWITEIHHDAAIVYPEGAEPYVLVILTEGLADHDESARLGAEVARAVHASVTGAAR